MTSRREQTICSVMTLISAFAMGLVVCHHLPTLPSGGVLELGVPWFFFASGFWYARKPRKWCTEVKKRILSLLLPYYLWNLIWFPILLLANWIGWKYFGFDRLVDGSMECVVRCLGFSVWQWPALVPTWFLRALFVAVVIVSGIWALGSVVGCRTKKTELLFRLITAMVLNVTMLTKHMWCPGGDWWNGFFVFGVPIHGLAYLSLGGVAGSVFGEVKAPGTTAFACIIRRQLMPIYVLHAIIIVLCGWVGKAMGVFDHFQTLPGDIMLWLVGVAGAMLIGELMRRFAPALSRMLLGGR